MKIQVKERKKFKSLVFEVPLCGSVETVFLPIPVPAGQTPDNFYKVIMKKIQKAMVGGN